MDYFKRKHNFVSELDPPKLKDIEKKFDLDVKVAASGFTRKDQNELQRVF